MGVIMFNGRQYTGAGSGGGSSVIPNPSGTPTDTLETIEIDGDIYEIQGSGGSDVVANPSDPATDMLNTIGINGTVYDIAGSGGSGYDVNDYYLQDGQISDGGNRQFLTAYYDKPLVSGKNYLINFKNSVDGSVVGTSLFKYTSDFTTTIAGGGSIGNITMIITSTSITSNNYTGSWQDIYVDVYREISSAEFYHPVIYSTEEREIGVWKDNKPLYQICKSYTVNKSTTHTLDFTEGNAKVINGYVINSLNNITFPLEATWDGLTENFLFDDSHFYIKTTNNIGDNSTLFLIVQYTKSSDTPGSGSYTTLGTPTVHYTTDEQVIGTWTDGKPLYQKTLTLTSITTDTSWHSVAHNIANINEVIKIDGILKETGTNRFYNINSYRPGQTVGLSIIVDPTNIIYMQNWIDDIDFLKITLQYTKSID